MLLPLGEKTGYFRPQAQQSHMQVLCHSACIDLNTVLARDLLRESALNGDLAMLSLLTSGRSLVQASFMAAVRGLLGRALD